MKKYLLLLLFAIPTIVPAQPRIQVDDIMFGTLGAGEAKTMPMRICNIGTDTLRFTRGGTGQVFIDWLKNRQQFTITADEIDRLAKARLVGPDGANACIDIMVTFKSDVEGSFRDSARLFTASGSRDRKDYSIWTAAVRQSSIRSTSVDWGNQWVVSPLNPCTRDTATRHSNSVMFANVGSGQAYVVSVAITGADREFFGLDNSNSATTVRPGDILRGGNSVEQSVYFRPAAERDYNAGIELIARDPLTGIVDTVTGQLTGEGVESHIALSDMDFGRVTAGTTATGTVVVHALPTRQTTITEIRIEDPTQFVITSASPLPTPASPWVMEPGASRVIELEFRPVSNAPVSTNLLVTGDFSACDDWMALLTGNATSGVAISSQADGNRILGVDPQGTVHLHLTSPALLSVEIFDNAGERLQRFEKEQGAGDGRIAIDRSGLAAGAYHVRISNGKWTIGEKFIVR